MQRACSPCRCPGLGTRIARYLDAGYLLPARSTAGYPLAVARFLCFFLEEDVIMLKWALIFFIISIVAGLFGFTGVAAGSAAIAKLLFGIALILFLIFLILGLTIYRKIEK